MDPDQIGIFLVEDDAFLRDRLYDLLHETYAVTRTADPRFALDVMLRNPTSRWILLTDYHLPEMTGAQLLTRALHSGCSVAGAVLMSGDQNWNEFLEDVREACLKNGIPLKTMAKPFLPEDLLSTLKTVLDLVQ